jgi:hypothetical protein
MRKKDSVYYIPTLPNLISNLNIECKNFIVKKNNNLVNLQPYIGKLFK